jgi:hypothetical protein
MVHHDHAELRKGQPGMVGQDIRIVSPRHLARRHKEITNEHLKQSEDQSNTVVALVRGEDLRALFALANIIRPEPKQAIAERKALGVRNAHLHVGHYGYRRDQTAIATLLKAGRIVASHATSSEGRNVQDQTRPACSTSNQGQIFWDPR